jgi:hypothetical protein
MALSFPNQSRSFDARQLCVRFWAYDASLEIPFFIEADALCRIEPQVTRDEPGLLKAFDQHRERILKAAGRVYVRNRRGSYTLSAADLG